MNAKLLLLLIMTFCINSFATEKFTLRDCQKPIKEAMKKGWTHVGELNLAKIMRESKKIDFVTRPKNFTVQIGDRTSAEYRGDVQGGLVYFNNQKITGLTKEEMGEVCVHEMMGALSYPDEDYTFSSTIGLINKIKIKPGQNKGFDLYMKSLKKDYNPLNHQKLNQKHGGDGIIVVGGGDYNQMILKVKALRTLFGMYNKRKITRRDYQRTMIGIQGCGLGFFDKSGEYKDVGYFAARGMVDREPNELIFQAGSPMMESSTFNKILYLKYPGEIFVGLDPGENEISTKIVHRYIKVVRSFMKKGYNCKKVRQKDLHLYGVIRKSESGNFWWEHKCNLLNENDHKKAMRCWEKSRK